jgi:hypothetical protein
MTNTKHTAEPWRIYWLNNGWPVITSDAHDIADLRLNGHGLPHVEANARRICAAVNACERISTEALERGIISEMRHVLGELLTAAGDLDAVIDGVTDQFDTERNRLNAAVHVAQDILDGGTEIDVHELLTGRKQIAAIWSIEDVLQVRPDLTDEQAWEVLERVGDKHCAEYGISWTTLECVAEDLFDGAPETDAEE